MVQVHLLSCGVGAIITALIIGLPDNAGVPDTHGGWDGGKDHGGDCGFAD